MELVCVPSQHPPPPHSPEGTQGEYVEKYAAKALKPFKP